MLYIRADGNAEIGTGHIMRCLSIAKSAVKLGESCTFITADNNMEALIISQGFHVICLDSVWNDLPQEIEKMSLLIAEKKIEKLLVDSYFATENYLQKLCSLTYIAYIDDLNMFLYTCNMLINYNIYANKFNYPTNYPNTKLLLGCDYAPLREEFQNLPKREVKEEAKRVLITTGGSDPFNMAGELVEAALKNAILSNLEFHVISGRFNSYLPMLQDLAKKNSNIVIHNNVQKMSELMLNCDIAISAGGSTLYELCACATPTILFTMADNQLDASAAFGEKIMKYSGDIRKGKDANICKILEFVVELASDFQLRCKLAKQMQSVVDGNGSQRLSTELVYISS